MSSLTLYSLPVPLGRRGSMAAVVIGAHIALAFGLWLTLQYIHIPKDEERHVTWVDPPPSKQRIVENVAPTDPGTVADPFHWSVPVPRLPTAEEVQQQEPTNTLTSNAATGTSSTAGGTLRSPARVLQSFKPVYPSVERRLNHEGNVVVRVLVGIDGRALEVQLAQSSGFERLDAAALAAVRRWKFAAARSGDSAVEGWCSLSVVFRLTD